MASFPFCEEKIPADKHRIGKDRGYHHKGDQDDGRLQSRDPFSILSYSGKYFLLHSFLLFYVSRDAFP
jgi:hypothetical protein